MADFWKNLFAGHSPESRKKASNTLKEMEVEDGEVEGDEVEDTAPEAASDSTQNHPEASMGTVQVAIEAESLQPLMDELAAVKAQLAALAQERESEQEAQAAGLATEASEWAREQVKANRILPAVEATYAQAYEKLSAMCNAAIEAKELDAVFVSHDDGLGNVVSCDLRTMFVNLVENGPQHGWTTESAKDAADNKVTFNSNTGNKETVLPDGTRLLSQDEIAAIVAQANGKKPAAAR